MAAPADSSSAAQPPTPVVAELPINLGQFVKLAGLAATGGEAKHLVVSGLVRVNAKVETRRGHKLGFGDVVETQGTAAEVVAGGGGRRPGARLPETPGPPEPKGPRSRPPRPT